MTNKSIIESWILHYSLVLLQFCLVVGVSLYSMYIMYSMINQVKQTPRFNSPCLHFSYVNLIVIHHLYYQYPPFMLLVELCS